MPTKAHTLAHTHRKWVVNGWVPRVGSCGKMK